jgi:tetratricopeptide (TPR) repeat protein
MGLRALFGKDPEADLTKAEQLLARGEPVRALELAERASRSDREDLRTRALELAGQARQRILGNVLVRAEEAEAKGALEEAASWLEAALLHERDEAARETLAARRAHLLDRVEEERNPFGDERGRRPRGRAGDDDREDGEDAHPAAAANGVGDEDGGGELDETDGEDELDGRYETLVAMLDEEVAPRYEDRPREFQEALVALNDGEAAVALPLLEALLADRPDDPVLHLERGRARLLLAETGGGATFDEAREDFERAWLTFGDAPLDATDTLSVPALAGEAALAAGDAAGVVERLAELADPAGGRVELCQLHAAALVTLRDPAAVAYLQRAVRVFGRDPRFPLLLAQALENGGQVDAAIDCLEAAIAPSSAGRAAGRTAKHPPSLRALAELHLRQGKRPDRAAELMAILAHEQKGLLSAADHGTLATYYRLVGDDETAQWCEAEAQRLRARGGAELSPPPGGLAAGRERVL